MCQTSFIGESLNFKSILIILSLLSTTCASSRVELDIVGNIEGDKDLSAISCISKKCLIASDETNLLQLVSLNKQSIKVLKNIKLGNFKYENDIEALTNDGHNFFAIASHSLTRKKGNYLPSRFSLFKIKLNQNTNYSKVTLTSLEPLFASHSFFSKYLRKPVKVNGINIEGLGTYSNKLVIGFRSPVVNGKAQILIINKNAPFNFGRKYTTKRIEVELGDSRGIRSLEVRGNSIYLIAGASDNGKEKKSSKVRLDLETFKVIGESPVPDSDKKLEGFEILSHNESIYIYDSLKNGKSIIAD